MANGVRDDEDAEVVHTALLLVSLNIASENAL